MSLDVHLYNKTKHQCNCPDCTIGDEQLVYEANITHNLGTMAEEAGIYKALWRPHMLKENWIPTDDYNAEFEFEVTTTTLAKEIIPLLEKGLDDLKKRSEYFKKFDAANGWGKYVDFVPFVEDYLNACKEYPNAIVKVNR